MHEINILLPMPLIGRIHSIFLSIFWIYKLKKM